jgi:hypothetical protein
VTMNTDPLKLFVVEYSITQDATHVRTLKNVLANNWTNLGNRQPSDYVPIGLFFTRDQADTFCVNFRQGIDQNLQGSSRTLSDWRRIRSLAEELLPNELSPFVLREA